MTGASFRTAVEQPSWSREFQFILTACRPVAVEERQDEGWLNLDWDRIVELAVGHRVLPQLHQRLTRHSHGELPRDVKSNVQKRTRFLLHRSLFLSAELIRIVTMLEGAGVNCLTFKGPSLAKVAYGDIASRTFNDIDLLVNEMDFAKAVGCLAELGYKSYENLDRDQQLFQMRSKGEILFAHPDGGFVDLHTSLSRGTYAYQVSWSKLWDNRQIIDLEGAKLATFGAIDLCLYLAIHGAKHRWRQLNWIVDFARAIRISDCEQVSAAAHSIGEHKAFQLGFLVCRSTLGWSEAIADRIAERPDRHQLKLLSELEQTLEQGIHTDSRASELMYLFRARQRPLTAILATIAEITTPHLTDWNTVRLPRVLWFCYVIIRPIRLILKRLGM